MGVQEFAHRQHSSLAAQPFNVGADAAFHLGSQCAQVHVTGQWHLLRMHPNNLQARLLVGNRHLEQQVKAAWAQQGAVDQVQPVRGGQDHHPFQLLNAIQLRQQLADHTLGHLARRPAASLWRNRINLVEEDNTGRRLAGFAEDLAHRTLGFAHPHAQ